MNILFKLRLNNKKYVWPNLVEDGNEWMKCKYTWNDA